MEWGFLFFFNSIFLGIGLAMDAFSVSLANGLNEPKMKKGKMFLIAGVFGGFQALMPLIGWAFVHAIVEIFKIFDKVVPWVALGLLGFIGIKMIIDGVKSKGEEEEAKSLTIKALIVQGIATSIDALSVGFTIADYGIIMALVCAMIIAIVTIAICLVGVIIGKKIGNKLAGKAQILGGIILIGIGLEIFISSFFK